MQKENPLGVLGIVLKTSKNRSRDSIVATRAGVIASANKKAVYISFEHFVVKEDAVLHSDLAAIREKVMSDPEYCPVERCSIQKAHKYEYGNSTHTGISRCRCVGGCANRCGCKRAKKPCSSKCACHGQCGNTVDFVDPNTRATPFKDKK